MKVVLKKSGNREFTVRLVQQVELVAIDCTKVAGVNKKISNQAFLKAWEALYVLYKENDYSNYVLSEVLKEVVESDNNTVGLSNCTLGNLIGNDKEVNGIAYGGEGDGQDIDKVNEFLSLPLKAIGTFYDQLGDCFKNEKKADRMEDLMFLIINSFDSEKISKTKVVQKAGDHSDSDSSEDMDEDYDFEE